MNDLEGKNLDEWFEITYRRGVSLVQAHYELLIGEQQNGVYGFSNRSAIEKKTINRLMIEQSRLPISQMVGTKKLEEKARDKIEGLLVELDDAFENEFRLRLMKERRLDKEGKEYDFFYLMPKEYIIEETPLSTFDIFIRLNNRTMVLKRISGKEISKDKFFSIPKSKTFVKIWLNNQKEKYSNVDHRQFQRLIENMETDFKRMNETIQDVHDRIKGAHKKAERTIKENI